MGLRVKSFRDACEEFGEINKFYLSAFFPSLVFPKDIFTTEDFVRSASNKWHSIQKQNGELSGCDMENQALF